MAFGYGPSADMARSMEANRKLLPKRKTLKENTANHSIKGDGKSLIKEKMSKQDLEKFRIKLKEKKRKDDIRMVLIIISLFVIISALLLLILF